MNLLGSAEVFELRKERQYSSLPGSFAALGVAAAKPNASVMPSAELSWAMHAGDQVCVVLAGISTRSSLAFYMERLVIPIAISMLHPHAVLR